MICLLCVIIILNILIFVFLPLSSSEPMSDVDAHHYYM